MSKDNYDDFDAKKHEDFYRKLRRRITRWRERKGGRHKWAEYLVFAPDLFYTLIKLMADSEVPPGKKAKVAGAITYFVSPIDIVPEAIVGPVGYIDDIFVAAFVLDDIINSVSEDVVRRNWPGDEDVLEVIKMLLEVLSKILGFGFFKRARRNVDGDDESADNDDKGSSA
ncbi:MAG: DUF1232 domain-containing protein [Polyangia bacterium]